MTPSPIRRSMLVWSFIMGAASLGASGQQPPAGGGDPVVVDFLAISSDGRPIHDLTAEQVTLRVDGRPRTLRSLQLVQLGEAAAPAAKAAGDPPPPPFGTNDAPEASRAVLFAIEDASIRTGTERIIREAISQFLGSLSSRDRVGIVTLPHPTVRVELGAGSSKVREALGGVVGRATPSATEADHTCRTRDTLVALRGLLASLAGAETPTAVLVFSGGLIGSARAGSTTGSGACDLTTDHFLSIGRASSAGRAHVYVIHADENVTQQNEGLEALAGVTGGGQVLRFSASGDNPVVRATRETSAYYVAAFDPDPKERDGQDHRVEVRLARPEVQVRSRALLTIPKGEARSGKAVNPRDMVKQTTVFRDLPLRVVGYPSRGTGDKVNIFIMAEPSDPAVKLTSASAAIVDASGRATTAAADEKVLAGRPIIMSLAADPGPYRVRFAAVDAAGRSGSVDYPVAAELTPAGPLKLSGLVVGALRDKSMAPAMQFRDEATAIGYVEIYGQLTGQQVSARMEVAATVDGPALKTIQPGGQATSEPDKFLLIGEIPIGDLKPGDYVVRAFVGLQGQPEGRVIRTLRKVQ